MFRSDWPTFRKIAYLADTPGGIQVMRALTSTEKTLIAEYIKNLEPAIKHVECIRESDFEQKSINRMLYPYSLARRAGFSIVKAIRNSGNVLDDSMVDRRFHARRNLAYSNGYLREVTRASAFYPTVMMQAVYAHRHAHTAARQLLDGSIEAIKEES